VDDHLVYSHGEQDSNSLVEHEGYLLVGKVLQGAEEGRHSQASHSHPWVPALVEAGQTGLIPAEKFLLIGEVGQQHHGHGLAHRRSGEGVRQAAEAAEDLCYLGCPAKVAAYPFHDCCNRVHGHSPSLRGPNRVSYLYLAASQILLVVADNVNLP